MMIERIHGGTGKILVQGHRGAMGHAPENTMVSFAKGYDLGADVIELDVHLSADKKLVVMHDPEVARTTDGSGRIGELTAEEIRFLDAGCRFSEVFRGARVPFLSEVLVWAREKIDLVIEIKGDPFPADGIEQLLIEEITSLNMLGHVLIISFYHETVRRIKELAPVPTGILYTGHPVDPVGMAREANADSFRCDWRYLTRQDVEAAHRAGLWVSCWGAETEPLFQRMADMGIDSMGCNSPDRLRRWLDDRNLGIPGKGRKE